MGISSAYACLSWYISSHRAQDSLFYLVWKRPRYQSERTSLEYGASHDHWFNFLYWTGYFLQTTLFIAPLSGSL